jgi:hypothetical protein
MSGKEWKDAGKKLSQHKVDPKQIDVVLHGAERVQ